MMKKLVDRQFIESSDRPNNEGMSAVLFVIIAMDMQHQWLRKWPETRLFSDKRR
jgi:hypothetical protein